MIGYIIIFTKLFPFSCLLHIFSSIFTKILVKKVNSQLKPLIIVKLLHWLFEAGDVFQAIYPYTGPLNKKMDEKNGQKGGKLFANYDCLLDISRHFWLAFKPIWSGYGIRKVSVVYLITMNRIHNINSNYLLSTNLNEATRRGWAHLGIDLLHSYQLRVGPLLHQLMAVGMNWASFSHTKIAKI